MRIAVKVLIVYGDTDTDEYITLCFMNGVLLMQPARSRVYVTVGCPSVCPSLCPIDGQRLPAAERARYIGR